VFTARYGLSPYMAQVSLVFKRLISTYCTTIFIITNKRTINITKVYFTTVSIYIVLYIHIYTYTHTHIRYKVKQSRYGSGVAQRVPGS
jgi:hypothetical protein